MLIKGILSFPHLFTPKIAKGATEAKFSVTVLLAPGDPQIPAIQREVDTAIANGAPSGLSAKANVCFGTYESRFQGTDYYDPRFNGFYVFSCTAKEEDRPAVVMQDGNGYVPLTDPSAVYSGMVAYVNAGISYYPKGTTGVGGWLNGVMITNEPAPFGRLDNKPSVEQMFANVGAAPTMAPPAAAAPPAPTMAPPAPPAAAPVYQMTAAANGVTREAYHAVGWSDDQLISGGLMLPPGGVPTRF